MKRHQWWYGLIGNDQIKRHGDEALTEYSTLYYEHYYGRGIARQVFEQTILNPHRLYESSNTPSNSQASISFIDWRDMQPQSITKVL